MGSQTQQPSIPEPHDKCCDEESVSAQVTCSPVQAEDTPPRGLPKEMFENNPEKAGVHKAKEGGKRDLKSKFLFF